MAALSSILLATTIATGAYSAYQQNQAGRAARRQGEYQGDIFDLNAADAERQAEDATARGREAESRHRVGVKQLIGSQRAGLAASGVDIGTGSARDVQEEAAYLGELDALTIRNNAKREALGYRTQAANLRAEGMMARRAGRNQQKAANQAAVGTLLTTGVQAYGGWRQYGGGTTGTSSGKWGK